MPYKNFSSFCNIAIAFGHPEEDPNHGFTASPVVLCEKHDEFDDFFFLLYRRSEYAAQIELACAKIFKMLMGYGPEMEIIQDGARFYIASRRIKNFKEGYPDFIDEDQYPHITGIAATRIIYYFLCGTDNHRGNFGMQKMGTSEKAFRIDMPEAFDLEMLNEALQLSSLQKIPYIVEKNFEGDNPVCLPQRYVTSSYFQNEKMDMINKIAHTPFNQFEDVLRDTVTVDHYSHQKAVMDFIIDHTAVDDEQCREMIEQFSTINPEENNLATLLNLFKHRHENWQRLVTEHPVNTQDLSLSDPKDFMAALNVYHGDSDSLESETGEERDDLDSVEGPADYHQNRFFSPSPTPTTLVETTVRSLQLNS